MTSRPKISCLTITEGRPEWAEWLAWNYNKQTYPAELRELIVVLGEEDRRTREILQAEVPNVVFHEVAAGERVPVKRNAAMSLACGDFVTWFDDDDWSSRRRVEAAVGQLKDGDAAFLAAPTYLFYYNLYKQKARGFKCSLWAYGLYSKQLLCNLVPFKPDSIRGSDSDWIRDVVNRAMADDLSISKRPMPQHAFAVSHRRNISNSWCKASTPGNYSYTLEDVHKVLEVSDEDWAVTESFLRKIRKIHFPELS